MFPDMKRMQKLSMKYSRPNEVASREENNERKRCEREGFVCVLRLEFQDKRIKKERIQQLVGPESPDWRLIRRNWRQSGHYASGLAWRAIYIEREMRAGIAFQRCLSSQFAGSGIVVEATPLIFPSLIQFMYCAEILLHISCLGYTVVLTPRPELIA